jgi:hypothetical protein
MKDATDIIKAQGLVAGGLNADNSKDLLIRLTLDMLGVPYKYVTGYRSSQSARLALQRGEIHFYSESPPSYRGVIEPTLVKSGEVMPLFYNEGYNGEIFWVPKQVEGMSLLPFRDFYNKIEGSEPQGQLGEAYLNIISTNGAMQRMIAFAPGMPKAAVAALRAALLKLENDPAYAEDAVKSVGFVPDWPGPTPTAKCVRPSRSDPKWRPSCATTSRTSESETADRAARGAAAATPVSMLPPCRFRSRGDGSASRRRDRAGGRAVSGKAALAPR